MEKIDFKNLPDKTTPINSNNMNQLQVNVEQAIEEVLNIICPIGKTEIFYDNEDHSNYLGFVWELTSLERSPIGYNPNSTDDRFKTIGNKFGEKEHTLTISEMPNHTHKFSGVNDQNTMTSQPGNYPIRMYQDKKINWEDGSGINYTGGNQAHNTIHPVEVMAFWKRVE